MASSIPTWFVSIANYNKETLTPLMLTVTASGPITKKKYRKISSPFRGLFGKKHTKNNNKKTIVNLLNTGMIYRGYEQG